METVRELLDLLRSRPELLFEGQEQQQQQQPQMRTELMLVPVVNSEQVAATDESEEATATVEALAEDQQQVTLTAEQLRQLIQLQQAGAVVPASTAAPATEQPPLTAEDLAQIIQLQQAGLAAAPVAAEDDATPAEPPRF